MTINNEDRDFISNFTGLRLENGNRLLTGRLDFIVIYNKRSKKRYKVYNKYSPDINDKYLICDSYDIEVDLFSDNIYRSVREMGRKIEKTSEKWGTTLNDLHYYKDTQKVCVFGYLDEKQNIGLKEFLGDVVIPFFYDQSFFYKYGKWPRGAYSHGCLGILENYYDKMRKIREDKDISVKCLDVLKELSLDVNNQIDYKNLAHLLHKKRIRPHWNCIHCGFGRRMDKLSERRRHRKPRVSNFKLCHPKAFEGVKILQKNIRRFNLKFE